MTTHGRLPVVPFPLVSCKTSSEEGGEEEGPEVPFYHS